MNILWLYSKLQSLYLTQREDRIISALTWLIFLPCS